MAMHSPKQHITKGSLDARGEFVVAYSIKMKRGVEGQMQRLKKLAGVSFKETGGYACLVMGPQWML